MGLMAKELYLGTVVTANMTVGITGERLVMYDTIKGCSLNAEDVWGGDLQYQGKVVIDNHQASIYEDNNGMLTSAWSKSVPWRVKI